MPGRAPGTGSGMPTTTQHLTHAAADLGGRALATVLAPLGPARDAKPLHPDGTVLEARLDVTDPAPALGVPQLMEAGARPCLVRISRALGTPPPLPDIGGLALRFEPDPVSGRDGDLLFASTGTGRAFRWLLLPRLAPDRAPLTTLLPLRSPSGPVLFALRPEAGAEAYDLSWARPLGSWQSLGRLALGIPLAPADPPIRFDAVTNPPAGLTNYPVVSRLREPAYAAARRLWPRH